MTGVDAGHNHTHQAPPPPARPTPARAGISIFGFLTHGMSGILNCAEADCRPKAVRIKSAKASEEILVIVLSLTE